MFSRPRAVFLRCPCVADLSLGNTAPEAGSASEGHRASIGLRPAELSSQSAGTDVLPPVPRLPSDRPKMAAFRPVWLVTVMVLLADRAMQFLDDDVSPQIHLVGPGGVEKSKLTNSSSSIRVIKEDNCFFVAQMTNCEYLYLTLQTCSFRNPSMYVHIRCA